MRRKPLMTLAIAAALAGLGGRASAEGSRVARGDFDRDGLVDTAQIVRGSDGHHRVVVRFGAKGRRPVVVYDLGPGDQDDFVARDKPGRYETACHKGYGPDARDNRPCAHDFIVLRGDVFSFGVAESSEAVALWTGRRFEVVWVSD